MSMNEFRRLATRIDQQMQQLAAEGVSEAYAVVNRMMGHAPDLHRIWIGTSDQQLMALSREFPGFYRYARIMEEASEAELQKIAAAQGMATMLQAGLAKALNGETTTEEVMRVARFDP